MAKSSCILWLIAHPVFPAPAILRPMFPPLWRIASTVRIIGDRRWSGFIQAQSAVAIQCRMCFENVIGPAGDLVFFWLKAGSMVSHLSAVVRHPNLAPSFVLQFACNHSQSGFALYHVRSRMVLSLCALAPASALIRTRACTKLDWPVDAASRSGVMPLKGFFIYIFGYGVRRSLNCWGVAMWWRIPRFLNVSQD